MSKQLLRFLLLSNVIVLGLFVLTWVQKTGGLQSLRTNGPDFSSPVLVGMLPFLFSFIYIIYMISRVGKVRKKPIDALDGDIEIE